MPDLTPERLSEFTALMVAYEGRRAIIASLPEGDYALDVELQEIVRRMFFLLTEGKDHLTLGADWITKNAFRVD